MNNRRTRSINLIADFVAPLAVVSLTLGLFFLFRPEEPGTLFRLNMVYTVFLELILIAYMVWLPDRTTSVALKWICGVNSVIYVIAGIIWMLIYSLMLMNRCPIKVYLAVIGAATVLWILSGAVAFKIDNAYSNSINEIRANRVNSDRISGYADMLLHKFTLLARKREGFDLAARPVNILCRGLSTLSPSVLSDTNIMKRVNMICSSLDEMIENGLSGECSASDLKDFAEESVLTLSSIKKSTLR